MATMFEKGQTKRYSRVSTGMSGGGEAKAKKRSKDDDKSEAAEANPYGSTKALNEATKNMRRGGMTESKKMMAKEVAFMKKKKAPKSMIAHEKAEMKGKKTKKYAVGGSAAGASKNRPMPRPANPRVRAMSNKQPRAPMPRPTANRPKNRPMPRPANPRPATPTRTPKARPMPRPTNSRPARTPKARPMPRPGASRPTTPRPANPRPTGRTPFADNLLRSAPPEQRQRVRRLLQGENRTLPRPANPRPTSGTPNSARSYTPAQMDQILGDNRKYYTRNERGDLFFQPPADMSRKQAIRLMEEQRARANAMPMKSGGKVKGYYKGGSVDGCVTKGRTKGKIK